MHRATALRRGQPLAEQTATRRHRDGKTTAGRKRLQEQVRTDSDRQKDRETARERRERAREAPTRATVEESRERWNRRERGR